MTRLMSPSARYALRQPADWIRACASGGIIIAPMPVPVRASPSAQPFLFSNHETSRRE